MTEAEAAQYAQWAGMEKMPEGDWSSVSVVIDGEVAGIVAYAGTEVHLALAPAWRRRAFSRSRIVAVLGPLIDRLGFLTTRALEPSDETRRFLYRLGFATTRVDGGIEHFMLTALPFEKRN